MKKSDITFYESQKLGRGLPFVIVSHAELMRSNDLFVPSLRNFHVIFWFKKGTGKYYIDFKEYTIQPNTVILLSKDHLHCFAPLEGNCELQSIVFNPEFIYKNDTDLRHLFHFDAASHYKGVQVLEPNTTDSSFLENISRQMTEVYHGWNGREQADAFYHLLCLFLIKCEQMQDDRTNPQAIDENDKLLMAFNGLLEEHFRKQSKVDFYVEQLGITVKTLSRIVKEYYNVSTKAVIDERRILEIKRQLKGTAKAVKEIAYELGFDEPTNMVKYFKKHTGQTPNSFRESEIVQ